MLLDRGGGDRRDRGEGVLVVEGGGGGDVCGLSCLLFTEKSTPVRTLMCSEVSLRLCRACCQVGHS